jgi:hypothetical protein
MRTSTATPLQLGHERTIRDIVERNHTLVKEVLCRKIFRQLLASLELQYTMQMPHRAITPDTVVIQQNGQPMLLSTPLAAADPTEAADLHALASVVHYMITREWPPLGPLRQRGLAGYSESLLGAIDRCLAPAASERPQTIAQLRNLLGIVSLGLPAPVTAPPVMGLPRRPPPAAPHARRRAGWGNVRRWTLVGIAALLLLGTFTALVTLIQRNNAPDRVVLSLPPPESTTHALPPNETLAAPPPAPPAPQPQDANSVPASAPGADQPGTTAQSALPPPSAAFEALYPDELPRAAAPAPAEQPPTAPVEQPPAATPAQEASPAAKHPVAEGQSVASRAVRTEYKLLIKPWGTIYVDGHDRGDSPPLKRLVLPAGEHTVRITNPAYRERVLHIEAGKAASGTIAHNFSTAAG